MLSYAFPAAVVGGPSAASYITEAPWITGAAPNHGIVLRDLTSDGVQFKQIWFGSRDGLMRGYGDPRVQEGPKLRLIYGF